MSVLVGNPEDRFSRDEAHIICKKDPLEIQHPKFENSTRFFFVVFFNIFQH